MSDFDLDGNRIGIISGTTAFVKEGDLYSAWVTMRAGTRIGLEGSRVAVLSPEGVLSVKEGNLWTAWSNLTGPGVTDFDMSGSRIAVVSGTSVLMKMGPLNAGWIGTYANSKAVRLS